MLSRFEAIEVAEATLEQYGFVLESASSLSEALYFRAPGYLDNLRVACHRCVHGYGVAANLTFQDDRGGPPAGHHVGNLTCDEVADIVKDSIEAYYDNAEAEEEA